MNRTKSHPQNLCWVSERWLCEQLQNTSKVQAADRVWTSCPEPESQHVTASQMSVHKVFWYLRYNEFLQHRHAQCVRDFWLPKRQQPVNFATCGTKDFCDVLTEMTRVKTVHVLQVRVWFSDRLRISWRSFAVWWLQVDGRLLHRALGQIQLLELETINKAPF